MTKIDVMAGCRGKVGYPTYHAALAVVQSHRANSVLKIYRCRACHEWHYGTPFVEDVHRGRPTNAKAWKNWSWRKAIEEV